MGKGKGCRYPLDKKVLTKALDKREGSLNREGKEKGMPHIVLKKKWTKAMKATRKKKSK